MRVILILSFIILPLALFAEEVIDLGLNPDTGMSEIRIPLPALPDSRKPFDMILIPSGSFIMGSSPDDSQRHENEWPAHAVAISKSFYIGKYEFTQNQWAATGLKHWSKNQTDDDLPVEFITWTEVIGLIKKLNTMRLGTFRLPTEAEWEYACRAGSETAHSFGDAFDHADEYLWWAHNTPEKFSHPVGLKKPNAWGLYDMHGNVSEWCWDQWQAPEYRGEQTDPQGANFKVLLWSNRVFKGGGFRDGFPERFRSAARRYEQTIDHHYSLGFRLVRDMNGQ